MNLLNELDYTNRKIYYDLLKMFQENNFKNGSFVSLGYFNKVEIPKRFYPSEKNTQKALDLLKTSNPNEDAVWPDLVKGMVEKPLWSDTLQGKVFNKSKKLKSYIEHEEVLGEDFSGIIKFSRYTFNFQDANSLGKSFASQKEAEIELRRKYGFGKEEHEYDPSDWRLKMGSTGRLKYRGHQLEPIVDLKDVNKGSSYVKRLGDFPIWGDYDMEGNARTNELTNLQNLSLRQNISGNLKKEESKYFLVKKNGDMIPVPKNFVRFLEYDVKQNVIKAIEELEDDEKEFNEQMKILQNKHVVTQFITNKIAFFVGGTENDKTKEKQKIIFYNRNLNLLDDNQDINKKQMDDFIKSQFSIAVDELSDDMSMINENKLEKLLLESQFKRMKELFIKIM